MRRFEGREEEDEGNEEEEEESESDSEVEDVPIRLSESVLALCQLEGRER